MQAQEKAAKGNVLQIRALVALHQSNSTNSARDQEGQKTQTQKEGQRQKGEEGSKD